MTEPTILEWLKSIQQNINETRSHLDRKVEEIRAELRAEQEATNQRVRELEHQWHRAMGVIVAVSAIATAAWGAAKDFIFGGN